MQQRTRLSQSFAIRASLLVAAKADGPVRIGRPIPGTFGGPSDRVHAKIPNDPVRGRPMSYERLSARHYNLRGFGPNERDDRKNPSSDDWLWKFPTNSPAGK